MQDVDLRDLAALVAVAGERNFRRAAIEQRVSASSPSQRMRDLEGRLGVLDHELLSNAKASSSLASIPDTPGKK
jgi:hypothetical protein